MLRVSRGGGGLCRARVRVSPSSRLKGYLSNIPSEHLGEDSGELSQDS